MKIYFSLLNKKIGRRSTTSLMWLLWLQLLNLMMLHDHVGRHIATVSGTLWKNHINCLHLILYPPSFAHAYIITV